MCAIEMYANGTLPFCVSYCLYDRFATRRQYHFFKRMKLESYIVYAYLPFSVIAFRSLFCQEIYPEYSLIIYWDVVFYYVYGMSNFVFPRITLVFYRIYFMSRHSNES